MIKASVDVNLKGFEDALDEINRAINANWFWWAGSARLTPLN